MLNQVNTKIYLLISTVLTSAFILLNVKLFLNTIISHNFFSFALIIGVYLISHMFRIFRLSLLALTQRDKLAPLIFAHAITVLPGSLLTYKLGEIFRLYAFFIALKSHKKALAIWLIERFGDISVITIFILCMYILKIEVPTAMRSVFIIFIILSCTALLIIFAVTKIFVYLNHYLVLESSSRRGLALLRISHYFEEIELELYRAIEGRLAGFFLLSIVIWTMEILALSIFIDLTGSYTNKFPDLFLSALLASLSNGSNAALSGFGLYQSVGLILLSFLTILISYFFYLKVAK